MRTLVMGLESVMVVQGAFVDAYTLGDVLRIRE
jgi:hypothetical protein